MAAALSTFGELLKAWREAKAITQEELGFRSGLSSKHISFLETGRAQPSRDTVVALGAAIAIPSRETNLLLQAAGLKPEYRESDPDAPTLNSVRRAIGFILDKHLPFPAWVVDGKYEVVMLNATAQSLNQLIVAEFPGFPQQDPMFHPAGLRRCIANWEDIATLMLRRMQREILLGKRLAQPAFERAIGYPGIPLDWRHRAPWLSTEATIEFKLKLANRELSFLTALTTFGSAVDTYVQELTIESCFPTDPATEQFCRTLQRDADLNGAQ